MRAACDLLRDVRPDGLIIGGDFQDFNEISRYNSGSVGKLENKRLVETHAEANRVLDQIQEAGGPGMMELDALAGNHEIRLLKFLDSGDHAVLKGIADFDVAEALHYEERGFRYHPDEDSFVWVGEVMLTHGIYTGQFHAKAHLLRYGCSIVYGHVHNDQLHRVSWHDGSRFAMSAPHMADLSDPALKYMKGPKNWSAGFLRFDVFPDNTTQVTPIIARGDRFAHGTQVYGAAA